MPDDLPSIHDANAQVGGTGDELPSIEQANAALRTPQQPERYQVWPERLARGLYQAAKSAFTLPGDVYAGRVDPLSEEGIGRSFEAATLLTPTSPAAMVTQKAAPEIGAALQSAARQGIQVPHYMAGETEALPRIAQGVRSIPIAGQPIAASAERVGQQLQQAAERVAPATEPAIAGQSAKTGLLKTIKAKPGVKEAYEGVEDLLHTPEAKVPLTAAADEVSNIMAERAAARIPGESAAAKLLSDAIVDPEGLSYANIKKLRSYLGEKTPPQLIAEGISPIEAKRLYGSLTEDLRSSVHAAGGQPALDAWEAANALARQTVEQRRQLYKIVGSKGDDSPEQVFSRLTAMAGSKSSADIGKLQIAKSAMGPEAWDTFTSGVISRLGRDAQGKFSPDRFVTGYSNLSPAARSTVFNPVQRQALEDLFNVSGLVRDKVSRFANVSKTTGTLLGAGEIVGLLHDPITTIGTIAGGTAVSWLLSRPVVVRSATNLGQASLLDNPVMRQRALQALRLTIAAELARRRQREAI